MRYLARCSLSELNTLWEWGNLWEQSPPTAHLICRESRVRPINAENAPVTMVTSVPWKRERDITEITPLWETPSLQPFLKTYWLTPVNDWPIVAKHANMTSSRGSINAAPATIRQNLNWTPLGWTSSDHGDHRDVSFPLSGNRGYHSNRSVPFQAVTRHHGDYSVMGTLFNPAVREATDSLNQLHSAKAFPPITELEGRAHSW